MRHPEHDAEQRYLVRAREALNRSVDEVEAMLVAARSDKNNPDAQALAANLSRRVWRLRDAGTQAPCFARIDDEDDATLYIGRQHIADQEQHPLVIDWRARAAEPFYRATALHTMGCTRRRQFVLDDDTLVEIYDTDLTDPDAGGGIPDPLLAEINRARTGSMREIVSTIQAEQDRIVRAPLNVTLVVQGGPGTGKTAVGLHRAAYLLFEHRDLLSREGVLVVGPNRRFLDYISDVLPSLGERSFRQHVPSDLGEGELGSADHLDRAHRRVAGDLRMAEVLRRHLAEMAVRPTEDVRVRSEAGSGTIEASVAAAHLDDVLAEFDRMGPARETWTSRVIGELRTQVMARNAGGPVATASEFGAAVRRADGFKSFVKGHWPASKPEQVVRAAWRRLGDETDDLAARAGFEPDDIDALRLRPARQRLTEADRPLLDEVAWQLGQRFVEYGHVILDEAQDLSPMALRMVGRRAKNRSFTVLGDVAQCSGDWMYADWELPIRALADAQTPVDLAELTVGYRVPDDYIALANALLPSIAPGLAPTTSIRPAAEPPTATLVADNELADAVASRVVALGERWTSVAVIVADTVGWDPFVADSPAHVDLLTPKEAKGLEFDAVVVVDPSQMQDPDGGWRPLFVALTRAVQHLELLSSRPWPEPLVPHLDSFVRNSANGRPSGRHGDTSRH